MGIFSGAMAFSAYRVHGKIKPKYLFKVLTEGTYEEADKQLPPPALNVGFVDTSDLELMGAVADKALAAVQDIDCIFTQMRMDINRVPDRVRRRAVQQALRAAAQRSETGFASKAERKEAAASADLELAERLHKREFERVQHVEVLYKVIDSEPYIILGAQSGEATEALYRLVREQLGLRLERVTAGSVVDEYLGRAADELVPVPWHDAKADRPLYPWISRAFNLKDFVGNEAALMLLCEINGSYEVPYYNVNTEVPEECVPVSLELADTLTLCCPADKQPDIIIRAVQGKPMRCGEFRRAIRTGKVPRKMKLMLQTPDSDLGITFTLQPESFAVSSAKVVSPASTLIEIWETRIEAIDYLVRWFEQTIRAFTEADKKELHSAVADLCAPVKESEE